MTCLNVMFVCLSKEQFKDSSREPPTNCALQLFKNVEERESVGYFSKLEKAFTYGEREREESNVAFHFTTSEIASCPPTV